MSADIKTLHNLDAISEMIGAIEGMSEGMKTDRYMDDIITDAHRTATGIFDQDTAAVASTGRLSHVYEFGTAGITAGKVVHPDPTAPDARLWTHELEGIGGNKDIRFAFRPATTRNPQPTTASTGVPSKYLRKLSKRKYIFRWKALVMESGMEVEIRSNRGDKGLLFVPTPGENAPRNFIMYPSKTHGALRATPGRRTQGTFAAHWMMWWGSIGQEIMHQEMDRQVTFDFQAAMKRAEKEAANNALHPPSLSIMAAAREKAVRLHKKIFGGLR